MENDYYTIRIVISAIIVIIIAIGIYNLNKLDLEENEDGVKKTETERCERYGKYSNIDSVPLNCKDYWKNKI